MKSRSNFSCLTIFPFIIIFALCKIDQHDIIWTHSDFPTAKSSEPLLHKKVLSIKDVPEKNESPSLKFQLRKLSRALRSYVNCSTFDYERFIGGFIILDQKLSNLINQAKGLTQFQEISNEYLFTKKMLFTMKELADYVTHFNARNSLQSDLVYRLFELEICIFTIHDFQGRLDLQKSELIGKILGFFLHLRDLKNAFKRQKSGDLFMG